MKIATQTHQIVRSYHDAWIAGDVTTAGTFLAEKFMNLSPLSNCDNKHDYLNSLKKFSQGVTSADIISELYGDDEATLVYDLHTTTPVGTIRSAEHFRFTDGKISTIILIYDATPWHAMLAKQRK